MVGFTCWHSVQRCSFYCCIVFPPPSARVVRHNVCRVGCLPCVDCAFVSVERVAAVYVWFLNQTNNLFRLSPSSISKFSISKFRIWVTGRSLHHLTLFNLTTTSLWWRLHQTHLLHFSTGVFLCGGFSLLTVLWSHSAGKEKEGSV